MAMAIALAFAPAPAGPILLFPLVAGAPPRDVHPRDLASYQEIYRQLVALGHAPPPNFSLADLLAYRSNLFRRMFEMNLLPRTDDQHRVFATKLLSIYNDVLFSLGFQEVVLPDAVLMAYYGQFRLDCNAYFPPIIAAERQAALEAANNAARMCVLPPRDLDAEAAAREQQNAQQDGDHWTRTGR